MKKQFLTLLGSLFFSALGVLAPLSQTYAQAPPCVVPATGGTVILPPVGCNYLSPQDVHVIINGLPAGTTVQLTGIHRDFVCNRGSNGTPPGVCDFVPNPGCDVPGGALGGRKECADSSLTLALHGTGTLGGWDRTINLPVSFETHVGPRTPGDPVQSFDTDMFKLQGQLPIGDPDFDLLRITAGTGFNMPSPGHTTLTRQGPAGAPYAVDSFFDIFYEIEFIGHPGGHVGGLHGSTTGTIRMAIGPIGCLPANCDDNNPCTTDACEAATGVCTHAAVSCDDGQFCTTDSCDPLTGQCVHAQTGCDDGNACTDDSCIQALVLAPACIVPDNGGGTVTLPPAGCDYLSPQDVHEIINGLPAGTTIQLGAIHRDFICNGDAAGLNNCSFPPPIPGVDCDTPGGALGGEKECSDSTLALVLHGTDMLAGFDRTIMLPVSFETHVGPRTPGTSPQSFDTDMFRLEGQITLADGDPDFDLLRIRAGTGFGMPSPGHTTLTRQGLPGSNWDVDSFFDIFYEIEFQGKVGGHVGGMSGTTRGVIRMQTGNGVGCTHTPTDCDDGNICTADSCDPAIGCVHIPIGCDDNDACTDDSCIQALVASPACVVPDNGGGTVTLPPTGCDYLSPQDVHEITNGLPPGTTIQLGAIHQDFICKGALAAPAVCSFQTANCKQGTPQAGEQECSDSSLALTIQGTGALGNMLRTINLPVSFETHVGPRTPGAAVQSFDTDMFRLEGQIIGDPDFDLLKIRAGTDFSMPSPGHTTLTRQGPPGSPWAVDSFFDIFYEIEFQGAPGGRLGGMSGSTTGTIRMQTGSGVGCVHTPTNCDDGDVCTADSCDPAIGCVHTPVGCDDGNACTDDSCIQALVLSPACTVPDNGGTVTLPPAGCDYLSPQDVHEIINGLPAGTTIEFGAIHKDFICGSHPGAVLDCSFQPPPGTCEQAGGSLGGNAECSDSSLALTVQGTGALGNFARTLNLPVSFETHVGPRTPGAPIQSFDTDMFKLHGQIIGDPDFDLLRIKAGTAFGMPSPGHTTLTRQGPPGSDWAVDSFFDIFYEIEFQGAPGGMLGGMSGTTRGVIHMQTGSGVGCVHTPTDCDDGQICTADSCDPSIGCVHTPIDCNDNDACTIDSCVQALVLSPACTVTDNGGGTVTLPPAGCDYLSPQDVHEIINGLPAGTTIEFGAIHKDFICRGGPDASGCSFVPPPGTCEQAGGALNGRQECSDSTLGLTVHGTGALGNMLRTLNVPVRFETHVGPRTPGAPVQSFATDMFRLEGQIIGDPDFDLLRIRAGTAFGMPSPGHTTLTRQGLPGSDWAVDSFFDIFYEIEFQGAPGGRLGGMSGSTTGTIRMQTGSGVGCVHTPISSSFVGPVFVSKATLTGAEPDSAATISWAGLQKIDAVRGDLIGVRATASYLGPVQACMANDVTTTSLPEPGSLVPGGASFYLLRASIPLGCQLAATYSSGAPKERPGRDAQINLDPDACP